VSNESVTDEIILEGFRSLKETMEHGFDSVNRRIDALETRMDQRFADVDRRFTEVHERIGSLEHRMMRRFDGVDVRFDNHERRITTLEAKR